MSSRGDATREALVRAAELVFAERGLEASLRDVNRVAGQRNTNALHYHFGDRESLLAAVLARHDTDVEVRRHALLDDLAAGGAAEAHGLADALVRPLAAQLADADGGAHYLRIRAQLIGGPDPRIEPGHLEDPGDSMHRWRLAVDPVLSDAGRALHHRFSALRLTLLELGFRAARESRGSDALFVSNLVDLVAAVLTAPPSEETTRRMRRRVREPRPVTLTAPATGAAAGRP